MNFPSTVPGDHALVVAAIRFATQAHHGQTRRYTGEPYVLHCLNVAYMVANRTMDPHVISAAVLHDVLEDTPTTFVQLQDRFSFRVAEYVRELTDFYTHESFPDLNRMERKLKEARRIAEASAEAQMIKAYDLYDNTVSITAHDPGFAKVYLPEKRRLLTVMTKLDPHDRMVVESQLFSALAILGLPTKEW